MLPGMKKKSTSGIRYGVVRHPIELTDRCLNLRKMAPTFLTTNSLMLELPYFCSIKLYFEVGKELNLTPLERHPSISFWGQTTWN